MTKYIFFTCIALFMGLFTKAQTPSYKVVFDMSSKDTVNQQALIRELTLIRQSNPAARMEVVVYGQGLSLVTNEESAPHSAMQKLLTDKDIAFKVCAMTMKRNNIDKNQLLTGVQVVPDGIYEIVSKQQEGWGYIKVAH